MKVLVACEYSGRVRNAFARLGHDVISCDLLPSETLGNHYQGDIRDILYEPYDLIIAHPPCTYLCNSGVRWLHTEVGRFEKMELACDFFNLFQSDKLNCKRIVRENPIPHKYAREKIGKYSQIVHPWQHGHPESKSTCLWLENLDELKPTNIVEGRKPVVHHESPGPNRWKNRSRTYQGIADAMAKQWG